VAGREASVDVDACAPAACDQVAGAAARTAWCGAGRASDRIVGRLNENVHVLAISKRARPCGVRTNVVAEHLVACRGAALDHNSLDVAGDQVERGRRRAAYQVVGAKDQDPGSSRTKPVWNSC